MPVATAGGLIKVVVSGTNISDMENTERVLQGVSRSVDELFSLMKPLQRLTTAFAVPLRFAAGFRIVIRTLTKYRLEPIQIPDLESLSSGSIQARCCLHRIDPNFLAR